VRAERAEQRTEQRSAAARANAPPVEEAHRPIKEEQELSQLDIVDNDDVYHGNDDDDDDDKDDYDGDDDGDGSESNQQSTNGGGESDGDGDGGDGGGGGGDDNDDDYDDDDDGDDGDVGTFYAYQYVLCLSARFMLIRPTTKIGHLMLITKLMLFYAYQHA